MTQAEAGKGDAIRPGTGFQEGHERIWPSPKSTEQCGDCNGTGRIAGKPCPACAPTDDGPGDGGGNET